MRRGSSAWCDRTLAEGYARVFREACANAGAAVAIDAPIAGCSMRPPDVTEVRIGPPLRLTVRLQPGMLASDVQRNGPAIAPFLQGQALRVVDRGHGWLTVTVLAVDPLAVPGALSGPVPSALTALCLGVDEGGQPVSVDLGASAHLIAQGATGSGKSVGCYGLLGQLAEAPDVQVAGSDISRLLLAPWADRRESGPIALGTADPLAHVDVIESLVADMDKRIAGMPPGRDSVRLGRDVPVVLAVLEEYPGLLRWVDALDTKIGKRIRAGVARLMAEGRKAGVRVLLITQRADASIVGAYERGQASHRLSFRVDTADGLKMLHPGIEPDVAAEHATAPPGVALLSAPGAPLTRLRAPLCDYATYVRLISGT